MLLRIRMSLAFALQILVGAGIDVEIVNGDVFFVGRRTYVVPSVLDAAKSTNLFCELQVSQVPLFRPSLQAKLGLRLRARSANRLSLHSQKGIQSRSPLLGPRVCLSVPRPGISVSPDLFPERGGDGR